MDISTVKRIVGRQTKKADVLMKRFVEEVLEPDASYRMSLKGYALNGNQIRLSILDLDELDRIRKNPPMIMGNARGYVYLNIDVDRVCDFANEIDLK
jgi:hypothetical protein